MKLLGQAWTPEAADRWTVHDFLASALSAVAFVAFALGATWAAVGQTRGWLWMAVALGASLLMFAVIDAKLKAQSVAFEAHEASVKRDVDERNRWEG